MVSTKDKDRKTLDDGSEVISRMGYILKCHRCERWYPEKFIRPFFTAGEYYDLDPECALKTKNEDYGFNDTKFSGEMAQQLLEDFREFKKGGD